MGDALSDKLSNISIDDRFDDAVSRRSNSVSSGTKSSIMTNSATKVQLLKRKKEELEKKLNEKYNQLQQVCREEAQIIGVYPVDFGSTDVNASTQTLRRRVGTSFKLPENLLGTNNNGEDEINKLMLEKQIQQQICEASLRLASDVTLSKNAIKIHKQTYDQAQQKLIAINQNLSKLKKLQAQRQIKQTQDDINLHKSPPAGMANSRVAMYNNKPLSATLAVDRKSAIRSNSVTNSPNAHHKQPHMFNTPQMRTRHDSFGTRQEYENSGKQSPVTPTLPYHAYNHPYQQQIAYHFNSPPQLHYHYPVSVGSSATMSGYPNATKGVQRGSKHYHHNTIQLPPTTIRQLNSSPQHHRHHPGFDSNGNQFQSNLVLQTTPTTTTTNERYLPKGPVSPVTPLTSNHMTSHETPTSSLVDRIESVQQAPGGYWLSMANNERIWFPVDNKYASLDRRSASTTKKLQLQSTKAISTGNIDMTATLADDAEARRREKKWCETSLDEPEFDEPKPCSPTPPLPAKKQYYRQDLQNANISPPPPPLLSRAPSEYSVNHLENGNLRPYPRSGSTATMNRVASPRTPEIPTERPNSVMMHAVSPSNSLFASPIVGIQSPLLNESPNVTIVEEGKIVQAYQEEEKPFEMSDFYKYSTKFRQKQSNGKT